MDYFVKPDSIVRKIWGKGDTILFIFAGASAEFALNKAVDWLYFTGKLPADPLGRLFSTVAYARTIIFSERQQALKSIDMITAIHSGVEKSRGATIPDWAYRDVLFMLIDYSIRSFEVLERPLSVAEREDIFEVFLQVGVRMNLTGLPVCYNDWLLMREQHLRENLHYSHFTKDLFKQYKKHLGILRFRLLIEAQVLTVPTTVNRLLFKRSKSLLTPLLMLYKLVRKVRLEYILKIALLPTQYKKQIMDMDVAI